MSALTSFRDGVVIVNIVVAVGGFCAGAVVTHLRRRYVDHAERESERGVRAAIMHIEAKRKEQTKA